MKASPDHLRPDRESRPSETAPSWALTTPMTISMIAARHDLILLDRRPRHYRRRPAGDPGAEIGRAAEGGSEVERRDKPRRAREEDRTHYRAAWSISRAGTCRTSRSRSSSSSLPTEIRRYRRAQTAGSGSPLTRTTTGSSSRRAPRTDARVGQYHQWKSVATRDGQGSGHPDVAPPESPGRGFRRSSRGQPIPGVEIRPDQMEHEKTNGYRTGRSATAVTDEAGRFAITLPADTRASLYRASPSPIRRPVVPLRRR